MLDILAIRDALNRLPFRSGQRRVFIGRISEAVELPPSDEEEDEASETVIDPVVVTDFLQRLESQLAKHDLKLLRDDEDRDALYAVQQLRRQSIVDLSWLRDAYAWSGRTLTVALEMVVPGVAGMWVDRKLDTNFIGPTGFVLGVAFGIWHLLQMTKRRK